MRLIRPASSERICLPNQQVILFVFTLCLLASGVIGSVWRTPVADAKTVTATATITVSVPPLTLVDPLVNDAPTFVAASNQEVYVLPQAVAVRVRSNIRWQLHVLASANLTPVSATAGDAVNGHSTGPEVQLYWRPTGSTEWMELSADLPLAITPLSNPTSSTDVYLDLMVKPAPGSDVEPGVTYRVDIQVVHFQAG